MEPDGRAPWRRPVAACVVVAVLVSAGVGVDRVTRGSSTPRAATTVSTTTATVVRSDLAETTPVDGTVGYASPVSVVEPAGTARAALTQAQQAAASAEDNVAADQASLSDTNGSDAQSIAQATQALSDAGTTAATGAVSLRDDQASLTAAQQKVANDCQGDQAGAAAGSGSAVSSACAADAATITSDEQKVTGDEQKVTADRTSVQNAQGQLASAQQKSAQGAHQSDAKLAADQLALTDAESALATAGAASTSYQATSRYTTLPVVGQVVEPGRPLWSVDGTPVPLLEGAVTAWRSFTAGMTDGPDVAALDRALTTVGDGAGLTPSDTFTAGTAAAIRRLQASLGVAQSGVLPLGSVIFEPTAVRVTVVHPTIGASVQGGAPVLDVTSTTPIVNVALPVDQTFLVKVGDPVTVNLPDGSTAKGIITLVGTVATNTTPSSGAGSNSPSATVNVTVSLRNPPAAATLDAAPVTVEITNAAASGALAVPVAALLALAGGGYALEVVAADGGHHLVGVTTGLFDDQAGLVEVSGAGLAAGQTVVVAA